MSPKLGIGECLVTLIQSRRTYGRTRSQQDMFVAKFLEENHMRNRVVFGLALLFVASALVFAQGGVAGKWTGEMQGRGGAQPVTLELTVSGTTVTHDAG